MEILSVNSRTSGYQQYGDIVVKNKNINTASNIKYKITYSKTKDGSIYDTEYQNGFKEISGGDTITESLLLKYSNSQYWYNIYIVSAEY